MPDRLTSLSPPLAVKLTAKLVEVERIILGASGCLQFKNLQFALSMFHFSLPKRGRDAGQEVLGRVGNKLTRLIPSREICGRSSISCSALGLLTLHEILCQSVATWM